jgi:hypothetical protein
MAWAYGVKVWISPDTSDTHEHAAGVIARGGVIGFRTDTFTASAPIHSTTQQCKQLKS